MLGKLIKHEMKATVRLLLPLYLILAVLTVMDRIVLYLDIFKGVLSIIPGFITFAYIISIVAIVAVTSIFIIIRFYKNLMTDEGYLMFTLPVKSHELIHSKLIVSFFWTVINIVAVMASILLVFSGSKAYPDFIDSLRQAFMQLEAQIGSYMFLFILELIIMTVSGIVYGIMMIYVSVAIGQLVNGHKVLGSFGAYIVISTVVQIITTVGTVIISFIFRNYIFDVYALPKLIFPLFILYFLIQTAGFYITTDFILKRKLNLD